jgi:hypothetical protein
VEGVEGVAEEEVVLGDGLHELARLDEERLGGGTCGRARQRLGHAGMGWCGGASVKDPGSGAVRNVYG